MELTDEQRQDLWGIRMVLLMEEDPQSNTYRQIKLNPAQFGKISDAVADVHVTGKMLDSNTQEVGFNFSEETVTLPDWLRDFYQE